MATIETKSQSAADPPAAPTADPPVAPTPAWTETTRLMCAAAYLDGTFAQDVVEEILHEDHRAVQVPVGVDVEPVAKHCVAARRQKVVRDILLAADLLIAVILSFATHSLALGFVLGFLGAWAVVLWDMWSATYHVVVKRLNALAFDPEQAPSPSDSALALRIEELADSHNGNLTVYSGFLPFSGAGSDLGGWSFVVDLRKGKDQLGQRSTPEEVEPADFYDAIGETLGALGIANLSIEDRLFVSGSDIRDDRTLLPSVSGRPVRSVGADMLEQLIGESTHRVRHYQCIRVVDWRGELVVSLFLRFCIRNGRLFCELSKFLLAPLKDDLHRIDGLGGQIELRQVLEIFGRSLRAAPGLWLRSPRILLKPFDHSRERARRLKQVERDPFFDYGAQFTALDRVRSTHYTRYFQRLDKEMYVKILERTVLDTIVDVLDRHGIETAELAERTSTIINNGIMMPGGSIQTGNLAVGSGAGIVNRLRSATGGAGASPAPAPASASNGPL